MIDKREFEQHKIQCFGFKFTTAPRHARDFISKNYDVYEQDAGQAPPVVKIKTEKNSSGTYMDLATKEDEMLMLAITSDYQYEVLVWGMLLLKRKGLIENKIEDKDFFLEKFYILAKFL